jgi:O-methyltransferase
MNLRELNSFAKGVVLALRPGHYLNFLKRPLMMASNTIALSRWIKDNRRKGIMDDFYRPVRKYNDREKLHEYIATTEQLQNEPIDYLEFGVCGGTSFFWWLAKNNNAESRFFGFDTFEGLPEAWGPFQKGSMSAGIPEIEDKRASFHKGLFQDTLFPFLDAYNLNNGRRKVIHMDADLFSSTLFTLTSLARYIKPGDIILFDEFNVPNHEFAAFNYFVNSFYIKYELLGAVNNYYQVAVKIK